MSTDIKIVLDQTILYDFFVLAIFGNLVSNTDMVGLFSSELRYERLVRAVTWNFWWILYLFR